ncbi:ABC transporter ATP-binding protein [Microbacterium sp. ProA8]|jgi:peptide/nickel transport system ATP-binding protein|uniref:ABC transporter ATP-binding protein n=1 Tax=Microbacterium chionoecetis TaxID=3153754 RepID=UPI003263454A
MTTRELLRVDDLVVGTRGRDGEVRIVDGVSFSVGEGEVLCLVGESGSGKSLTMAAVLGLLPAGVEVLGGSVSYRGRDLLGMPERELRALRGDELAMVFQDPMTALNPVKRVGAQIARAVRLHGERRSADQVDERVEELLRSVGVPDPAERARAYPHQWSGGMRQRAVIAMAIAHDPRLLVADEPTTALDVTIQAQIMQLLADARRRSGAAMVLITHDLGLVAQTADEICIMYSGRIVERGSVWDIFDRPRHPYTAGLLASLLAVDRRSGRAYAIPGSPPAPAARPQGCAFAPRCELAAKSEECLGTQPGLVPLADGHAAACHHVGSVGEFARAVAS